MAREARTDFTAKDKTGGAFKSMTQSMNKMGPMMVAGMAAIATVTAKLVTKIMQLPAEAKAA